MPTFALSLGRSISLSAILIVLSIPQVGQAKKRTDKQEFQFGGKCFSQTDNVLNYCDEVRERLNRAAEAAEKKHAPKELTTDDMTPDQISENETFYVNAETAKKFLKEKSNCFMAVGGVAIKGKNPLLYPKVFCVMNAVSHEGTVNEKSGCSLALLDMKTGQLGGIVKSLRAAPATYTISDESCMKGGFNKLMKMKPFIYGMTEEKAPTNAEYLYDAAFDVPTPGKLVLLFSEDDGLKKYFDDVQGTKGHPTVQYTAPSTPTAVANSMTDKIKSFFGN